MRPPAAIAALGTAAVLGVAGVAAAAAWYAAGLFLRPPWYVHRTPEQGLLPRDGDPWAERHWQGIHRDPERDFGLAFENVEFPAVDGAVLRGWLVPGGAGEAAVVTVHGGGGDRRAFLRHIPFLHEAGYAVLLFDCREQGVSDGNGLGTSLGVREHEDVVAAVRYLRRARGVRRVAVVGTSVGAVSAILAASVAPEIDAVVAESAAAELDGFVRHLLHSRRGAQIAGEFAQRGRTGPLRLLRMDPPDGWVDLLVAVLRLRIGAPAGRDPIDLVSRVAPRPILLIHGSDDAQVPVSHARRLFAAAGEPKELWIVEGGGHSDAYNRAPAEFRRRVVDFLDRSLRPDPESAAERDTIEVH